MKNWFLKRAQKTVNRKRSAVTKVYPMSGFGQINLQEYGGKNQKDLPVFILPFACIARIQYLTDYVKVFLNRPIVQQSKGPVKKEKHKPGNSLTAWKLSTYIYPKFQKHVTVKTQYSWQFYHLFCPVEGTSRKCNEQNCYVSLLFAIQIPGFGNRKIRKP